MPELLDIATVVDRDTVLIRSKKHPAGKPYELVNLEELGAFEYETILARHGTMAKYAAISDRKLTAVEERTLRRVLGDILKLLVLGLEPAVLAEMETVPRAKIVSAWSAKNTGAAEGEQPASPPPPLTTAGSSRASKRSTAASRKRGSTSRAGR